MGLRRRNRFLTAATLWLITAVFADAASVKGRFSVTDQRGRPGSEGSAGAVVWLVPVSTQPGPPADNSKTVSRRLTLMQKNKRFDPHVLVVETGTLVDFPNGDPFFHNVFSLFDGKRFDLGLYEAGGTRSVRFDRPGICYIFCNIHAEMSAVVIAVNTPYWAISNKSGEFEIPAVPAGRYALNVWAEGCLPKLLKDVAGELIVSDDTAVIGTIHLQKSGDLVMIHANKYGKPYDPDVFSSPAYPRPSRFR
jgi:plastocyanin